MATISSLRKALSQAKSSFHTISNLVWEESPILRSKFFAECRVTIDAQPILLSMPLTPSALHHIEALYPHKPHIGSEIVPQITLLRDEMLYFDSVGNYHSADIVLEPLAEGIPLKDALAEAQCDPELAARLAAAVEELQQSLDRANISHNNLKEENIIFDHQGHLRPIRWHYATYGRGGDKTAIDALRTKIAAMQQSGLLCEPTASYSVDEECDLSAYLNSLGMAEGLIAVETDRGWGYVDCCGKIVIEPQYQWVGQFCESRAEVETDRGMGLIDKSGQYIIQPDYPIVDYNPVTGHSLVNDGEYWAEFDYSGNMVKEFGEAELKI